mgnify:CR=1 FL=1
MATKEYFPGIGKIKFEGKEVRILWHSATTMRKSIMARR